MHSHLGTGPSGQRGAKNKRENLNVLDLEEADPPRWNSTAMLKFPICDLPLS